MDINLYIQVKMLNISFIFNQIIILKLLMEELFLKKKLEMKLKIELILYIINQLYKIQKLLIHMEMEDITIILYMEDLQIRQMIIDGFNNFNKI